MRKYSPISINNLALQRGFSLPELLIAATCVATIALLGMSQAASTLSQERVESATRRLAAGLEQARLAAVRSGQACGLRLGEKGWEPPLTAALPGCRGPLPLEGGGLDGDPIQLQHNLPDPVRFSANGLVIDGGTVRIAAVGSTLVRCLVISLPLGVVRLGRWQQETCQNDVSI